MTGLKLAWPLKAGPDGRTANRSWILWHAMALLFLLAILLIEFQFLSDARFLSDESFNFRQISRFRKGDFSMEPLMNVIPGYHALVAGLMAITNKSGIYTARFFSMLIAFAAILTFYLLTWQIYGRPSLRRTFQFAFFPLFFPFFPLVYTDILSLLLTLLAFLLVLRERYVLSGLVGIFSVLARTNHIIWLAFLYAFIYVKNYGTDWRAFPRSLLKTWVYWAGFALFLAFLIVNRGIGIMDKSSQPLFVFSPGNIYFLLFLFAFLFLPQNLANLSQIFTLFQMRRWVFPALLLLFLVFLGTFQNTHPFNLDRPDYYWRNALLIAGTGSLAAKSLFFIPIAFSIITLGVTRLRQTIFYWLYPFTLLGLLPFWLIETRYAFVPLSLFLLLREESTPRSERLALALYAASAFVIVYLQRYEIMFL